MDCRGNVTHTHTHGETKRVGQRPSLANRCRQVWAILEPIEYDSPIKLGRKVGVRVLVRTKLFCDWVSREIEKKVSLEFRTEKCEITEIMN